jgi:hypothetical protein
MNTGVTMDFAVCGDGLQMFLQKSTITLTRRSGCS